MKLRAAPAPSTRMLRCFPLAVPHPGQGCPLVGQQLEVQPWDGLVGRRTEFAAGRCGRGQVRWVKPGHNQAEGVEREIRERVGLASRRKGEGGGAGVGRRGRRGAVG